MIWWVVGIVVVFAFLACACVLVGARAGQWEDGMDR